MVNLLSQAQGGPAVYTWSSLAPASDIGNLLLYGPTSSFSSISSGSGSSREEKKFEKAGLFGVGKVKPPLPPSPSVVIELSGDGPLRTGPWAASNLAFRPSPTQNLTSPPFLVSEGDADLREVLFTGFNETIFRVVDENVLQVVEGGFLANGVGEEEGGLVEVEGGTMYCHRCYFIENTGMKIITASGPESLMGLSFSRFINNVAVGALVEAQAGSRGGFASTSFINNTVINGAVLALTNGSVFLGQNSLFKSNVGGDLLADDSHYRVDKTLFTGSRMTWLEEGLGEGEEKGEGGSAEKLENVGGGEGKEEEEVEEEPYLNGIVEGNEIVDEEMLEAEEKDKLAHEQATETEDDTRRRRGRRHRHLQDLAQIFFGTAEDGKQKELEGSVARLYGSSSLQGSNLFIDQAQGPAIQSSDASNVTLGRPCFTQDTPSAANVTPSARFVESTSELGELVMWGACAFPSLEGEEGGLPDVFLQNMSVEQVALTPYTDLNIGGQTEGVLSAQNGSCLRECEASFAPPRDWDPSYEPSTAAGGLSGAKKKKPFPPGFTIIFSDGKDRGKSTATTFFPPPPESLSQPPSDVKFDEKTGMVNVKYPDDYKGDKIPSFQIPFGISFVIPSSSSGEKKSSNGGGSSGGEKRALLRGGKATTTPFPARTIATAPMTTRETTTMKEEELLVHAQAAGLINEKDVTEIKKLLPTGEQSEIPNELYSLLPPLFPSSKSASPTQSDTTSSEDEKKKETAEGTDEEEEDEGLLNKLKNDLSAPWENNRGKDAWMQPDWTFLAHFPLVPNAPIAQRTAQNKQVLKAAKAYQAYTEFLASNPGIALPSSAVLTREAGDDEVAIEGPTSASAQEPENIVEGEDGSATVAGIAVGEPNPAAPIPSSSSSSSSNSSRRVCPEGQAPLILYLDSGSTGANEECMTQQEDGQAAFYFTALSGGKSARTLTLPATEKITNVTSSPPPSSSPSTTETDASTIDTDLSEVSAIGSDFTLLQILDLGCQPPSNLLEVELRNELMPDVVCSRWSVPGWADTLEQTGMSVILEGKEGEVVTARPVDLSVPVDEGGREVGVEGGVVRRRQFVVPRERRRLQVEEGGSDKEPVAPTVATTKTVIGDVDSKQEEEKKEEGEGEVSSSPASSSSSNSTTITTFLTAPITLSDASGGSFVSLVLISEPTSLDETVIFDVYLPELSRLNGTVGLPSRPPSSEEESQLKGEKVAVDATILADGSERPQVQQGGGGGGGGKAVGGVIGALLAVAFVAGGVAMYRKRQLARHGMVIRNSEAY